MSSIPAEIPGIGASTQKVRVNPAFNPIAAGIGPQEYFVFSRVDGNTPLRDLLLATGLPPDVCVTIAQRLRSVGAILLPNESAPPASAPRPATASGPIPAPRPATASGSGPTRTAGQPVQPAPRASAPPPLTSASQFDPPTLARGVAVGAKPTPGSIPPLEDQATIRSPKGMAQPTPAVRVADLDLSLPDTTAEEMVAMTEPAELSEGERRRLLALARLVAKRDPWAL